MQRWDDSSKLHLLTPTEFDTLPDGFELGCINGTTYIKGVDFIQRDVRGGYLAYGIIDPMNHPEAELLTFLKLS